MGCSPEAVQSPPTLDGTLTNGSGVLTDAALGSLDGTTTGVPDARVPPVPDGQLHTELDAAAVVDAGTPTSCATPWVLFETRVWPEILEARCVACHSNAGIARQSAFVLTTQLDAPETYRQDSFEQVKLIAGRRLASQDNRSLLELKPTLAIPHEGREVIEPGSHLHQLLLTFIGRVDGEPCPDDEPPVVTEDYYRGVTFLEPRALLRRVSLSLLSRPPTHQEIQVVTEEGMVGFQRLLDAFLDSEPFLDRVKEGFDDVLLTRGYVGTAGALLAFAFYEHTRHWPQSLFEPPESWDVSRDYEEALRREPVELIAHIVRHNRPFTDIIEADYTVVSPYTARGYGVFEGLRDRFQNPDDPFEFIETRLPAPMHRNGRSMPSETGLYPHAGVLTMPQFLHRYPNTDTNRNRARARFFYQIFLGFDVMASAPVVNDSAAVTAMFDNPTLEAPDCVTCHRIIDPLAGLFQDFDNKGDYHFRPEPWYDDMRPPGFQMDEIPEVDGWRRLQWLGNQAASDPRFALAMAEHVYYILTQERVLKAPQEGDENERAMRKGFAAQRAALTEAAIAFRESQFNLKVLFKSLITSQFYRASGLVEPVDDPERRAELDALGLGALVTPEQLYRRVLFIFGARLPIDRTDPDQRRSTYLLYGGIDHAQVTTRAVTPNGIIGALMRIHGHQISCRVALKEFWGGQAEGVRLFPFVDHTTTDEVAIRDNLVWLHQLILGQYLARDDPEINRSFNLFQDTVRDGALRVAAGEEDSRLIYDCRAEQAVPDDPDYLMRGWQAVIYYLVLRPEFLLQ